MKSKGFTLLEVISAIFILTVGVGGAFSLISQTLSAASLIESRLTASYLAQEGIEIVKNLRDRAWLERRTDPAIPWDEYIPKGNWEADYLAQDLVNNYGPGTLLNIDANGFYSYSPGAVTKFKRKITVGKDTSGIIDVSIIIEWKERGRTHNIEILENITNWYE
ncbi:MAG: prepilin-type N-terminal cleavage/methylation domain-containing protein [Patescibacteria group bacterium]|nr:prepilin-type N-terminal cleavage/methylation domain-containing protein [Patescibacteria group bacterium]